ncbi:MAG: RNA polymerase sigma factor [Thiotrichales bacterium]|nr:MAG: RNA polymerase sigma factor [Thiotrichales bacterium]
MFCDEVGSLSLSGNPALDFKLFNDNEHHAAKTVENREALNRFLASVEKRAFRMAELATSSQDHALDIVQDAMLSLVKNYSQKSEAEWGPLFHRILQSKIRDWYRRSRTRNSVFSWLRTFSDDNENDSPDPIQQAADTVTLAPDDSAGNEQLMAIALDAIRQLPLRQQQAFLLRAWEGLDVRETARAMNCSQGSVKTHYSRASKALRRSLEAYKS